MEKITVGNVARELGVMPQTVYNWIGKQEVTPETISRSVMYRSVCRRGDAVKEIKECDKMDALVNEMDRMIEQEQNA